MKKIFIITILLIIIILISLTIYKIRTFPLRGNYVLVDYRNDAIIFFQSSDITFRKFPNYFNSFSIIGDYKKHPYTAQKKWNIIHYSDLDLEEIRSLNICTDNDIKVLLSRIEYGMTPECFKETIKATELEKGVKYYLDQGYVPKKGNLEYVYFMLDDCKNIKGKLCLFTNSPIKYKTLEIKE